MDYILAIIQARMGSAHLPGKVLKEIHGRPLLGHIFDRLEGCPQIRQTVVATSVQNQDLPIVEFCRSEHIPVFQGSEDDILDRFFYVACKYKPQHVVRITADCPLVDPNLIGKLITKYLNENLDYGVITSGGAKNAFPEGLGCEIFRYTALEDAWANAQTTKQRETVSPYIWEHSAKYRIATLDCPFDLGSYRLTVESLEDLALVETIYRDLAPQNKHLQYLNIVDYLQQKM